MKLKIYPDLIIRIPQFHLDAELEEKWDILKESIRYSSPEFYEIIKDVSSDHLKGLPHPIFHSIWKYFNRSKHRATPYGSFASFGFVKANQNGNDHKIKISNEQVLHKRICWTQHGNFTTNANLTTCTVLFANSSYYKFKNDLRFLVHNSEGFEICEVPANDDIVEVLQDCIRPIPLYDLMQKKNWTSAKKKLIQQMLDLQLIFTDASPNLIGTDYFERREIKNDLTLPQYIIAERKVIKGYPDMSACKDINNLISLLDKLLTEFRSPSLEHFKTEFNNKFESRFIPIMQALDPEIGISFSGNEEAKTESELIEFFNQNHTGTSPNKHRVIETLLLKANSKIKGNSIDLSSLEKLFDSSPGKLPNTIGMLCSIVDERLIVEHIGGATAISVLGRYSIASGEIEKMCVELAEMEQKSNPDVLFFDIGYVSEIAVDNVNRRSQIYPLQLSILNFDISTEPLTLDDIYVTVREEEIRLYSKKWKKRLIPRLSTAYNYNRSDLPLFRFLCELQYQGLKSNLAFNLSDLIPGQDRYPRLHYKNIILSPAKWKLSAALFKEYIGKSSTNTLSSYLKGLGIEKYTLIRTDDRTICFDIESKSDMVELEFILKKFQQFYIEEGFIPINSIVSDAEGNAFTSQFTIALHHDLQVYQGMENTMFISDNDIQRSYGAGSEWLYYDIYVHPFKADYLLQEKIFIFLKKHRSKIRCWFFVRFDKDGQHLRVRIKLYKKQDLGNLIIAMADLLESEMDCGLISEFKISRYQRELERYSPELMDTTEHLFFTDSKYVLALLSSMARDEDKYLLCIELAFRIRDAGPISSQAFEELLDKTAEYFLMEHNAGLESYRRLNKAYKELKSWPRILLTPALAKQLEDFGSEFITLLFKCPQERREKLFIDLFHMHINRLFAFRQRTHEMIIYYFMIKRLQYEKAISKLG